MRPLFYSELDAATKKIGWIRTGENIKYYKNAIKYGHSFFYFTCYLCSSYEPYLRKNDSLKGTLSFLPRAFSYQTKFHVNSQSIVVCYFRREDTTKEKYHYSLTWTCEFPNENDTYYFAHCYPYTYSDLQVSRVFILKYLQMSRNVYEKKCSC